MIASKRRGDWLQVFTGGAFWPLDPRPEEVFLEDIAHALSNLCRFGGHVPFYSVGQHSVLVSLSLPHDLRVQGLLHDATEAYLIDVPRPIKRHLKEYAGIESALAACLGKRFGVELVHLSPKVHEADNRCLMTEKRDLCKPSPLPWNEERDGRAEPWRARITPWTPEEAKKNFLALAATLGVK